MATRPSLSDSYDKDHLDEFYPQLRIGDRLEFKRDLGYSHWALFSGSFTFPCGRTEYRIIHRSVPPDVDLGLLANDSSLFELICSKAFGAILEAPLESALEGSDTVRINNSMDDSCHPLPGEEIVQRAVLKMAESPQTPYNLMSNNCENFVNDCRYKRSFSHQVVEGCIGAFTSLYELTGPGRDRVSAMRSAGELAKACIPNLLLRNFPD